VYLPECRRCIEQIGEGYRLSGPGVSVLLADIADATPADLTPHMPRKQLSD
jgi:hypothetical protein